MPQQTCVPVSTKIAHTQNAHHVLMADLVSGFAVMQAFSGFKIKYHQRRFVQTNKLHHSLHNAVLQTRIDDYIMISTE